MCELDEREEITHEHSDRAALQVVNRNLHRLMRGLGTLGERTMTALDDLKAAEQADAAATDAAVTEIAKLASEVTAISDSLTTALAAGDGAAVTTAANAIAAHAAALTAAVTAATSVAPAEGSAGEEATETPAAEAVEDAPPVVVPPVEGSPAEEATETPAAEAIEDAPPASAPPTI